MFELSDLRYFQTVAREGSMTRAADVLHRVQSNVTTRIRKLEDALGTPLFIREGKRLILTADGHRFLGYADRLLALADEAGRAMAGAEPGGIFRLGAMESTAAVRLPGILADLTARHPGLSLELQTGNPTALGRAVLAGDLDAAFAADPPDVDTIDTLPAFDERIVIVTGLGVETPGGTILTMEKGCPHRARLEAWYAKTGRPVERIVEMGSYHAMFGCVLAGMGAALVPESVIDSFPEAGRLRRHPLPGAQGVLTTCLFWRRDMIAANTRALIEVVSEASGFHLAGRDPEE